jgi:uncharacterized membrane protein YbhN (UPF0104 family)
MVTGMVKKIQTLLPFASAGKFVIVASVGLTLFTSLSLGYFVFQNWALLLTYDWQFDLWSLTGSFLFYTLNLFLAALGWFFLLRSMGASGNFADHFQIFVLSNLARNLPGRYWHITGRMMLYQEYNVTKMTIAFASGLEMVLMLNGAIIGYLLASPWGLEGQHWWWRLLLVSALSFALIHPQTINWLLRRLGRSEIPHRLAIRQLLQWLALYTAAWLCGGLMLYQWLCAMTPVPLAHAPTAIAAWTLTGVVSNLIWFIPGTFGVRETTLTLLFTQFIAMPTALLAAILLRILLWGYQLIFFLIMFIAKATSRQGWKFTPN